MNNTIKAKKLVEKINNYVGSNFELFDWKEKVRTRQGLKYINIKIERGPTYEVERLLNRCPFIDHSARNGFCQLAVYFKKFQDDV